MKVFVTGATGFIGSAIVKELIGAGHQVLGLARSDAGAKSLIAAGAQVHRGDLEDLESLRAGAAISDGVIHTAFNHDFSRFQANCEADRQAIEVLGSAFVGSDRPLIVTSGTDVIHTPGRVATEEDAPQLPDSPRRFGTGSGFGGRAGRARFGDAPSAGPRPIQARPHHLPDCCGPREGFSAYVGDGLNRWPAVHLLDAAHLYRLVLEKGSAGARYHAVAEEGVPVREIAESAGRGLNVPVVAKSPEEAASHFGWLGHFVGADVPASSALTQERLGWRPTGPGLLADLDLARYVEAWTDSVPAAR